MTQGRVITQTTTNTEAMVTSEWKDEVIIKCTHGGGTTWVNITLKKKSRWL